MLEAVELADPVSQLGHVGVAITRVSDTQNHVGILYRDGAEVRLSHLRWHHMLSDDAVQPGYLWAACGLFEDDEINAQTFAARMLSIRNNGGFIPYGFYSNGNVFTSGGEFIPFSDPAMGLTCSTYVIEVFESFGLNLVEVATWEARDSDLAWQQGMLATITQYVSAERAEEAAHYVGAVRIRPEEAAAAVINEPPPLIFEDAKAMALQIQELLDAA